MRNCAAGSDLPCGRSQFDWGRNALYAYRIAGLTVASEIELTGAVAASPAAAPEVTVRAGPVPEALEGVTTHGTRWEIAGDCFLLRIPDLARFLLTGGREIVFEALPGVAPSELSIFLIGTVFGMLLHQRGYVVLHASAVRVNDRAVLFCGPSGSGKSTLAAALAQRGFPVVTDDVCALAPDADGTPVVQSDGRRLKLWEEAIAKLDLADRRGGRVNSRTEKFFVEPSASHAEALPLGAVYMLREANPPHAAGIERPNAVDAAILLRRNAYRPNIVRRMGQRENYFLAAGQVGNTHGLFHLTRVRDFAAMPEVIAMLERHWADIGLTEKAA